MRRLVAVLVLCLSLTASCRVVPTTLRLATTAEGWAYVYLDALPQEAQRLRFRVAGVSVRTADGREIPLDVLRDEVSGKEVARQRLLARGPAPLGPYAGLTLEVADASLGGPDARAELVVPEPEARIDLPFTVDRTRAAVVSLRLHGAGSVTDAYRFAPEISAVIPSKPTSGPLGVATGRRPGVVTIFDKTSGRVAAVLPVRGAPGGVALERLRQRAYIALPEGDAVDVIDLRQFRAVDRIPLQRGDRPVELTLTPDRNRLLVVNTGSDTLSIVDPASLVETRRIIVGNEPASVLVDRDGRLAYVFNTLSNSISVIDVPAGVLVGTIVTDTAPLRGKLDRRGERLFVIHGTSAYLTAIDTSTLEVAQRTWVGPGATALEVDPRTDLIYLARRSVGEIEIYDTFSLFPVDSIPIDSEVAYLTIDDEGNNLGLVLPEANEVRILRLVGRQTVARIDIGDDPVWMAFLGER